MDPGRGAPDPTFAKNPDPIIKNRIWPDIYTPIFSSLNSLNTFVMISIYYDIYSQGHPVGLEYVGVLRMGGRNLDP